MEGAHRTEVETLRRRRSFGLAVLQRQWWPPVVPDDRRRTLQVEGREREVSEGRGLGEERLGGRHTEEREESGGAGQIPTDDGAPVLGRATGTSARGGSAWLRWLGRGREENGAKRGTKTAIVLFLRRLGGAGKRKRERGPYRCVRMEDGEGGEGGPWRGGGQLGAVGNSPWPSGMGDAGDGLSVTDGQDRGETRPGGSDRGAREKERERWGGGGAPTCGTGRHSGGR
jgi:hypothetical protein